MHFQQIGAYQECQNRQCSRQRTKTDSNCNDDFTKTAFCSQQCAYIHTLNTFRQKTAESQATMALYKKMDDSDTGCVDGRWHTATLIRWGIDPWSSAKMVKMRRLCCQTLLHELGKHWSSGILIEYAWALENINYSLSYLPEYAKKWHVSNSKGMLSTSQGRYNYLCAVIVKRLSHSPALISTLLYQAIHPTELFSIVLFQMPVS